MCDVHGIRDVTLEPKENVSFSQNGDAIEGSTVNNILLALFVLHSNESHHWNLPGGLSSWFGIKDYLPIVLLSVVGEDAILCRVFYLIDSASSSKALEKSKLENIASGALGFVQNWIERHSKFIPLQKLVSIGLKLQQYRSSALCGVEHCNFMRHCLNCIDKCLLSVEKNIKSGVFPVVDTKLVGSAIGMWEKCNEKRKGKDYYNVSSEHEGPIIAVFGITQSILDCTDESDTDDAFSSIETTHDYYDFYKPRIPCGLDLLQDCHTMDVWEFDIEELARQWTLLDHALFVSIPLSSLYRCHWCEERHVGKGDEVKRFIDRFNAETCWATQSIMNEPTPEKRAKIFMNLIKLGSYFEDMNNFSGLMAIVSTFKQGCIAVLEDTIALIDNKSKELLHRLQSLMSEAMNHITYRNKIKDLTQRDNPCGVVPHLGAHLAEISSISEGTPSHIPGTAHLLNIKKICTFAQSILEISNMQLYSYGFRDAKIVQCALLEAFSSVKFLSSSQMAKWSQGVFATCQLLENKNIPTQQKTHVPLSDLSFDSGSRIGAKDSDFERKYML